MSFTELISKLYSNVESKAEKNFNIFEILNLEYDEVRLHSRILKYFIEKDIEGFKQSIASENPQYKNILSWLSRYQKNVKEFSVEHITLSQYIEVLNKICGIMDDKQKERIIGLMSNEAISSKLFYLKHDINTIESKIHDFWEKTAQQSHLAVSNISENTVCVKDGSIMLDIFQKSRNHINFYLEYKTNFHEAAFCGIWFNSSYLFQLQPILTKYKVKITDGFIDKKLITYSKETLSETLLMKNRKMTYKTL